MPATAADLAPHLEPLAAAANDAGVFAEVRVEEGRLACRAKDAAEEAWYRLELDESKPWVSLVMKDRWLSESIEAELMHTGDKIEELIEEEMADHGYLGKPLPVEHFRSEALEFTFRSAIPADPADPTFRELARQTLLGYEACFRELGDMSESDED